DRIIRRSRSGGGFAVVQGPGDRSGREIDRSEVLTIYGEGRQLDGNKTVAALSRHDDALRLARHFYDDRPLRGGPVETAFLHHETLRWCVGDGEAAEAGASHRTGRQRWF